MRLHVADHPLITHKLTVLRDQRTSSPVFRQLTEELVTLLAYEATRSVRVSPIEIQTPVTTTTGVRISEPRPIVVPILRAGLGSTGGSLGAAIEFLFRRGAQDVTAICLLGAPEGVAAIERQVEGRDVTLVLGAMDERLNEKGYIVPGLGDAGDRLYGTV